MPESSKGGHRATGVLASIRKMKILASISILLVGVLCSCDRQESVNVSLKVGGTSKDYALGADWVTTQNTLVSAIRPLWEGLTSGSSAEFQIVRTLSLPLDPATEKKLRAKDGNRTIIIGREARSSPSYRFFRNRVGRSGVEQIENNHPLPMMSGESVDWGTIESYLREDIFSHERMRLIIGEQDAP